jgi:hypothetical protein
MEPPGSTKPEGGKAEALTKKRKSCKDGERPSPLALRWLRVDVTRVWIMPTVPVTGLQSLVEDGWRRL